MRKFSFLLYFFVLATTASSLAFGSSLVSQSWLRYMSEDDQAKAFQALSRHLQDPAYTTQRRVWARAEIIRARRYDSKNLVERTRRATCVIETLDLVGPHPFRGQVKWTSDDVPSQTLYSGLSNPWTVRIRVYRPRQVLRPRTAVIIVPPTGGFSVIDRTYGRSFCGDDILAVALESFEGDTSGPKRKGDDEVLRHLDPKLIDPEIHDMGSILHLSAIRFAHQFIIEQHEGSATELNFASQAPRIGILGNSVGGLLAGLAMQVIDEIQSGVIVVAGASLSEVLATSEERTLRVLRPVRMALIEKFTGQRMNTESYRQWLDQYIFLDPTTDFSAGSARGARSSPSFQATDGLGEKSIFFVSGESDTIVPFATQMKLLDYYGAVIDSTRLRHKMYQGGHAAAIIWPTLWQKSRLADFLKADFLKGDASLNTEQKH